MLYGNLIFIKKTGGDGSKFPVTQRVIKIGRSEDCLIRIYNPHVASEHCQLIIEENGQATLRNFSNQTILNGKLLSLGDAVLSHGDIFKLGERLARWEYLPTSKYYSQVLSPTKRLVAVVIPQQRFDGTQNTPETSATHVSVLKKTPVGKKKLSENGALASTIISKINKSSGSYVAQRNKNDLSKFSNDRRSFKATKLILTGAKPKGRQSHSGIISLKTNKNADNKTRRSTMPSWKVNIVSPTAKKSTASKVSIKKLEKTPKSIKKSVKTPSENSISTISQNLFSASNSAIKTPQKAIDQSKSKEIVKLTSKRVLKTPSKGIMKSPSTISDKFFESTSKYKYLSPKEKTLKTPSKLAMSTPKPKSRKSMNQVYSESKILPLTGKESSLPKGTSRMSLILEKVNSDFWPNSRRELLNLPKECKDVLSEKIMLKNLSSKPVLLKKEAPTGRKSLKNCLLKANLELVKTPRRSLKNISKSPREVKIKTPRQSLKTARVQSQKQTPVEVLHQSELKISTETHASDLDDFSSSLKKKPRKSISVKNTPVKETPTKLNRTSEKTKSQSRRMSVSRKKRTSTISSPTDGTPKSAKSPVKVSTTRKSQKSEFSSKKLESLSKSRQTSTRGTKRKLSPSATAERAAKKLKTSCPKKPDKNKKAALLVLGIANRNRLLSQNVKVLLKKAIKQSNAASARKISAKLERTAKSKKVSKKKTTQAKTKKLSKKNKSSEKTSLRKVSQTSADLVPKSDKITEGNQQSAFKVLEALVGSPEEKAGEITGTTSKQIKNSETPRSIVTNKSFNITPTSFDKSAENYLFNTNRRCSKRLSSKNDTGRPDFIELSPTALGLIPKNIEIFKTPKVVKRSSSSLVTPKNVRSSGIIKSASTSKISKRKSVRFSSKDLSFNLELTSPNVSEKTDFDFSSFRSSDITMDVFVSPMTDENNGTSKDLNVSNVKITAKGNSKSATKNQSGKSSPKTCVRKILQSPQRRKSLNEILSNENVTQINDSANLTSGNLEKTLTVHKNEIPENDLSNFNGIFQVLATPTTQKRSSALIKTPKQQKSPKNDLSDLREVKKLLKTPKPQKSPKNDLSGLGGVKKLLRTPKQQRSPKNDLSDLRGVKKLLKTPKQQKSPKNDLSDLRGVKKLLKTPKQQKSPKNDLSDLRGVKKLLKTPKQQKSPKNDLSDLRGVKKLLKTPKQQKSPKNDLSDLRGVKKLLKTPKQQKSPKNDLSDLRGVKKLLKTPIQQKSPKNDLSDLRGVKKLLKTPKQQKSPKNDLSDLRGVKKLLKTPIQQKSPKNDLSDLRGVKKLLKTPKQQRSPKNDLSDLRGVKKLLKTPKQQKSPKNDLSDISGCETLFKTPDIKILSVSSAGVTPKLNRTSQSKETSNEILRNTEIKELLVSKSNESLSKNKRIVPRKSYIKDFKAIRGRRTISSKPKSPKNDLSDLTGVRELFSTHKPINDLNVDMSGVAELFVLPESKDVSKQVVKPGRRPKTVTSRLKKLSEVEEKEVRVRTRSRLRKTPEKETKKEIARKKKIETSSKAETESKKKIAIKRKADEKIKTSRIKNSSAPVSGKQSGNKSKPSEKAGLSKKSSKQPGNSLKRKVQFDEVEVSPPKQRRKLTASEQSVSTSLADNSKKAVSKPKAVSEDEVPAKRGRKVAATKKDQPQKASSKVQPKKAIKSGTKQIQKVQSKRSQSTSKMNVSDSEIKVSPRKTRSAKTKTVIVKASSKSVSKEAAKKMAKGSIAERKKDTPVALRLRRK